MKKNIIRVFKIFLIFTVLCGVIYPLLMTSIGQAFFNEKSNGTIIEVDGVKYGSELLGQNFTQDKHLWGRPVDEGSIDTSSFVDNDNHYYFAYPSNISPESDEFKEWVINRKEYIKAHNKTQTEDIPSELIYQSGSGLDPHISYETAIWQIPRLVENTNLTKEELTSIIDKCSKKSFGFVGKKYVNVLMVNLYIEGIL